MKKPYSLPGFSLGLAVVLGVSSSALADQAGDTTIAVKFGNVDFSSSQVAGVTAVQTKNWNLFTGATGGSLSLNQDISGSASSVVVAFTYAAPEVIGSFNTPFGDGRSFQSPTANAELMYGGLGSTSSTASLTLAGLSSAYSSGFSLYIYTSDTDTNSRGGSFTVDGGSPVSNLNTDPGAPPDAWVQSTSGSVPGDYVLFTGLTGSTLTISMTAPIDNEIEGFEIVATGGSESPIPEPSTYAMLVAGLLVLGCYRKCIGCAKS